MKKIAASFVALAALAFGTLYAQSCPGVVTAGIKDDGGTPIGSKLTVTRAAYFESTVAGPSVVFSEEKFENTHFMGFNVTESASASSVSVTPTGISFPANCQTYSVQLTLSYEGQEMAIGFYNLSNDKSIEVGDITFAPGKYYVDMENGNSAINIAPGKFKLKTLNVVSFGHTKNLQGM